MAASVVWFIDVVNPAGVTTETVVDPGLTGVNCEIADPEPAGMLTGEAIVPTAVLLLFRVTCNGAIPPRSACRLPWKHGVAATLPQLAGSVLSTPVKTVMGVWPPLTLAKKKGAPNPNGPAMTTPDGANATVPFRLTNPEELAL